MSATSVEFVCRSCNSNNSEDAKFCANCGTPLWEPCPACKKMARIGQKFCGECGHNLLAEFEERVSSAKYSLDAAQRALEDHDYVEAIAVASKLINPDDPRVAEISKQAESIVESARQQREDWEQRLEVLSAQANEAFERKDYPSIQEMLAAVPEKILTAPLRRLLEKCRSFSSEQADLKARLKAAIAEKNFMAAGGAIDQLIQLEPENREFQQLGVKIGAALAKSAEKHFRASSYAQALARLEAVPKLARESMDVFADLEQKIDNVVWLTEQVARSPFATPTLGRLVQRLVKQAPHDERAPKLLQQLATRVKAGSKDPLSLYADWIGSITGWRDSRIQVLGLPRKFDISGASEIRQNPTRFAIALGLGLQGLGKTAFSESLSTDAGRGGLRKLLKRRTTAEKAWGIDIGSSMIRAVLLKRSGDTVVVEKAESLKFDAPLCRASIELKAPVILREKLGELAEKIGDVGDTPVWTNLASRECLGRYQTLPPVAAKQLAKLLEKEVEEQFPLELNQLCHAEAIVGKPADGSPRAVLLAAKRTTVEQREKLFAEVGIPLTGIQAEGIALHNYNLFELEDLLGTADAATATPNAVCLIEGGATGMTLYVGTRDAFWFRFLDGGGEDLTAKLAGATSLTLTEAETKKQNPAELEPLELGMSAIESRISQSGVRINQYFDHASQFLGEIRLERVFVTGGLPLTHGWIRHIFSSISS